MRDAIPIRHPDLELSELPRYWYAGDPFKTHFFDALSSVFPEGEAFFVRSVMRCRGRVDDPALLRAIRGFAGQEGEHSRQHAAHIALLEANGYRGIPRANTVLRRVLEWTNRRLPVISLASTAALEHLTALMARALLGRPEAWTDEMDPRMRPLWRWHAVEEAEHKAVAFDVLARVVPPARLHGVPGALLRGAVQINCTLGMLFEIWLRMAYMLAVDGLLWRPRDWLRTLRWLFGRGGLLRGFGHDYWRWYRRDFHPDEVDDRGLIAGWERAGAASPG